MTNNRTNEIMNNREKRDMGRQDHDRGDDRNNFRIDHQRSDRGNRPHRPREDIQRYVYTNNNHTYNNNNPDSDLEYDERVLAAID